MANGSSKRCHPGEGRGPIGKVAVTERRPRLATLPNWAPASAGVGHMEGVAPFVVLPRRREPRLGPRLRGETSLRLATGYRMAEATASNERAASPCGEAALSISASHGQSPCRRSRRAAPAGLGRVLHQLGAGRPAPQNRNATVPRRLCQRKLSSERLNAVPAVFGASTNGLFAGCVPRVTRTRASSS